MKVKILQWRYYNKNGHGIERVYLEQDFAKAESDYELLSEHSDHKQWQLLDVNVYDGDNYSVIKNEQIKKIDLSVLDIKIRDIRELSTRSKNVLSKAGICTVKELTFIHKLHLESNHFVGQKTMEEVEEFLLSNNLSFKKDA